MHFAVESAAGNLEVISSLDGFVLVVSAQNLSVIKFALQYALDF